MVLFDLARAAGLSDRAPRRAAPAKVRASVQRILDATSAPTYVRNARFDILAANPACFALYSGILSPDTLPLNLARFVFLDPRALSMYLDWDTIADDVVAALRGEAGRNPLDRSLSDLIGELTTRSPDFGTRWARHNVRHHRTAVKRLHNPAIGEIEITGEALEIPGDGITLITYTAPADSHAQQQLDFLASWSTSPDADKIVAAYDERQSERHAININHGE